MFLLVFVCPYGNPSVGAAGGPQSSVVTRQKNSVAARTVDAAKHKTESPRPATTCIHSAATQCAWKQDQSVALDRLRRLGHYICGMHIPRPLPSLVPSCAVSSEPHSFPVECRWSAPPPSPTLPDRCRDTRDASA
ncbi:hypothetical protein E2C01_033300 [Portunus trituberculatus]|uniref:Uncharacterized protein n=1 Tax=Portunus trituberculatus TaxID=210409 RepID=A0A5B7EZS4_PORTR|nr:hypothetical protein [Portunus trituberculatus]